ncbi:hypothetical protein D8674_017625 [Pyrus ussuriensis x Pyrus communis]|uniref:Reverse transcriptase domain-containing protein n=1 Tax=Pyrus ussuriensis x Pyrus communis TaxID=2448454 RepID=A0A5N5HDM0_9ROSA|nr:hypothetical protein D8674_017625 [Pyrus ussuriensis x Pyrus communis]
MRTFNPSLVEGVGGIYYRKSPNTVNEIKGRLPIANFDLWSRSKTLLGRYKGLNITILSVVFLITVQLEKRQTGNTSEARDHLWRSKVSTEYTTANCIYADLQEKGDRDSFWLMANQEVEELVVHLEKSMEITTMERGIKLVGTALTNKVLNKWGAHDNTFIITVKDESSAERILSQVPWAVMKQNFSIKRWPSELAIEEIPMELVHFWVQIRGVPLCLCTETNVRRLAKEIRELVEIEDPAKARGFLRVRVIINTKNPLAKGCWIPRESNTDSWIEFRYERLQDFCYKCGRIGHANNECSFETGQSSTAGYGEWTKTGPIRDESVKPKPLVAIRGGDQNIRQRHLVTTESTGRLEVGGPVRGTTIQAEAHSPRRGQGTWHRMKNRMEGQDGISQKWVVDGNMAHVAHQVFMGMRCLGPQPTTIFNYPSPLFPSQAARFQEIQEMGENILSQSRGKGGNIFNINEGSSNEGKILESDTTASASRHELRLSGTVPRIEFSGQHGRPEGGWSSGAKRGSLLETRNFSLKRNKLGEGSAEGKKWELPQARKKTTGESQLEEKWDFIDENSEKKIIESTTQQELNGTKGSDTVVRALHGLIRKHRPAMIFLAETKMRDNRVDGVRRRMGYRMGFHVSPIGRAGGLSMWWDDSLEVTINYTSKHIIDAKINYVDSDRWARITWVYGTAYRNEKEDFWGWMKDWFKPTNILWLCGGDFNEILWDYEKSGGTSLNYNRPRYLEEFLNGTELMDMDFNGPCFTWRGMRNGHLVEERLDRGLANRKWQDCWPNTMVIHETVIGSDHCPLIIQHQPRVKKSKKIFRFEAYWAKEERCKEIVDRYGRKKMDDCREQLNKWSQQEFKSRGRVLDGLLNRLGALQQNWSKNWEEIKMVSARIDRLWEMEEQFWQQRSRVKWLKEGDANTAFFHRTTIQRRRRNKVVKVKDGNGVWIDNQSEVQKYIEDHFINLFSTSGPREWGTTLECIQRKVSAVMNNGLVRPVTLEEIQTAAFQMGGMKAPGPDGFQGIFYHSFWNSLMDDVNGIVQDFMQGDLVPQRLNSTHIVLIPKIKNLESVGQFRPISLCNYSYKIVSKILANRLKPILSEIISSMQSAFVMGRQIQDNIGIAHEMFHFLKLRKARSKFEMRVKLDMHKAYYRVEWDFLEAVMEKLGFCLQWRNLVMGCVKTVEFAIILNGQPGRPFIPSRGICQGDPLSPYLFILVGEVLARLIQQAVDKRQLTGVQLNFGGPIISHLFFADDTLIFMRANKQNCDSLMKILDAYCNASSQKVSYQKSCVFFGANVPRSLSGELSQIVGMPLAEDPGKYLGLSGVGRILEKVQGWKQCTLSQAGKEIMIKAVIQAIPAYPMHLFKFPTTLCSEFDALIADFWWGKKGGRKVSTGFLVLLKARYFPQCSFLDAKLGGRASWGWSSAHWQIMDGRSIRLWQDRWLPTIPAGKPTVIGDVRVSRNMRVNTMINELSGTWDIEAIKPLISTEDYEAILDTYIGDRHREDRIIWPATRNGVYSVRSGYHWKHACSSSMIGRASSSSSVIPTKVWRCVWHLMTTPKVRNFMWRALNGDLATMENLFKRRCSPSPSCPICLDQDESVEHMLLLCPWVEPIWFGGPLNYRVNRADISNLPAWVSSFIESNLGSKEEIDRILANVAFTCWHIWKTRCNFVYDHKRILPNHVIMAIVTSVNGFMVANGASEGRPQRVLAHSSHPARWAPPCHPFMKLNVDASWEANSKLWLWPRLLRFCLGVSWPKRWGWSASLWNLIQRRISLV